MPSCDPIFVPDPATHLPPENGGGHTAVSILPGDHETVQVEYDASAPCLGETWLTLPEGAVARFDVEGMLVTTVEVTESPFTATIVGLQSGETQMSFRRGASDGVVCGTYDVKVGGSIQVEYNHSPTFMVYPQASPTGPGGGSTASGGAGVAGVRGPIDAHLLQYINDTVPIRDTRLRVTIRDAEGHPKPNKSVRLLSRDGILTLEQAALAILNTDEDGRVEAPIGAQAPSGTPAETGYIEDMVAVLVGRAAERFGTPPYTEPAIDEVFTQQAFPSVKFTGHHFRTTEFHLEPAPGAEDYITAMSLRLLAINHAHAVILENWLESSVLDNRLGNLGAEVSFEIEPGLPPIVFTMTAGPTLFSGGAYLRERFVESLAIHQPPGFVYIREPIDPEDPPPCAPPCEPPVGGIDTWAVITFAAQIGWGFVPFAPDVLDLSIELGWKPLHDEEPNSLVVTLSGIGFAADAGYITVVGGAAGNVAVAVLKQVAKRIPDQVLRELLDQAGSTKEVVRALWTYVSRINPPPGAGMVASIQHGVSVSAAQVHRLMHSALSIPADKAAAALLMLSRRASRWFSDDAAEGLGFLHKHGKASVADSLFDDFAPDVVEASFDLARRLDLPSGQITDDAVKGVGAAIEAVSPQQKILVQEFLDGTQIAGNAARQAKAFENMAAIRGVDGLDDMVAFLRNNASNANGIDGVIFEGTVARRIVQGEVPALGTLQRVSHDGIPNANTIDTLTSEFAIQIKGKVNPTVHFVPSDFATGSLSGEQYLDLLASQAAMLSRQPCLVTNRAINATLQDMLDTRGITWVQVAD